MIIKLQEGEQQKSTIEFHELEHKILIVHMEVINQHSIFLIRNLSLF